MRFKTFPILIILAFLCLSLTQGNYHKVKFIYDGDTIVLDSNEKVRYPGINTPGIEHKTQKSEFIAFAARDLNTNLAAILIMITVHAALADIFNVLNGISFQNENCC